MSRRLAVLEAQWWSGYSHSVKPFFEGVVQSIDPEARKDNFHYERFVGSKSLEDNLGFLVKKHDVRVLYLASHGEESGIQCPNHEIYDIRNIGRTIAHSTVGTRLDGLHLGSCLIGNMASAEAILAFDSGRYQRVKWVAGYTKSVDWLDSTILDVYFLSHVLECIERGGVSPIRCAQAACNEILFKMSGLYSELGFHVWARQKHTGLIIDILQVMENDQEDFIYAAVEDDDVE